MKRVASAAAIAALVVSALGFGANVAQATKIVPIQGKYSKIKLDGICAANGGQSYGAATGGYGCTKGPNTVECSKEGDCKGYIGLEAAPTGLTNVKPGEVLQMSRQPVKPGVTTGAAGKLPAAEATVAP